MTIRAATFLLLFLSALVSSPPSFAQDGNRLAHLDGRIDPYYPGTGFAKLTTAQWIGEPGVTTAAVLSIDDMRDSARYESFIRPILDRLKKIEGADGRAPLSIFTCTIDPQDPHLQTWLKEGVSIEVHTIRHPCPLLAGGNFAAAKKTVDDCTDLLWRIPNMQPVCYRMPCCDSMNSLSPRFFAEIFNKTTPNGSFLQSDSSMFVWFNEKDKDLPPELVAGDRFGKYMPRLRGWVNWIENYPYPYVIGNKCWEFPSVIPTDWEAQHRHGKNNEKTVEDLKAALDATVIKEGLFTFVFHPHGWIKNTQVADLVDYADTKYGGKVRFLNAREVTERITKNMLLGQPLRKADGSDNGVRVLDLNNDGYMDVVIANEKIRKTRLWDPEKKIWKDTDFPARLDRKPASFAILRKSGYVSVSPSDVIFDGTDGLHGHYQFHESGHWEADISCDPSLLLNPSFHDVNGDGISEIFYDGKVFSYPLNDENIPMVNQTPPESAWLVDLNGDRLLDYVLSDGEKFEVRLFDGEKNEWCIEGRSGKRGDRDAAEEIPPIVRADGTNNGAWVHGDRFYWQNEDTVTAQSQVDSRSFEFLRKKLPKKVSVLDSKPLSPEEALATFATSLDLEIDIVAAEPEVMDPIDFAWGIDGKLWVVEMADYPLGLDGKGKPGGRVRWLEDRDGDGRYEKSVLFLDGLPFPTGVMPWREGVLVLAAPELIYAKDRDGDGTADHREVLYRGFGEGNQQHRFNGLRWGLDNWIHIANGDSNGVIESVKNSKKVNIQGRDLRIRPDTGEIEATSGRTQYGRNRDDWGNWFGCNNSVPMWHFVLPDRYLKRNPHVAPPRPTVNLVRTAGRLRLFPTSSPLERFNDHHTLNHITSACGAMIYRAKTLPLYGDAFVCEPVHNLIVRQLVRPDGYSFVGTRAPEEQRSEFFTSTDPWCRPVSIRTGPDGCLWVADMYRLVIEHPEWIPDEWQKKLDLRSGHDRGRIYRIKPKGHAHGPALKIDGSIKEIAARLGSENGTVRDLAHQALIWRQTTSTPPAITANGQLVHIERQLQHANAATRVHALSLMNWLDRSLKKHHLERALIDDHPAVRRQAIRLSEALENDAPLEKLAALASDPDPQVRLQLAFSLGEIKGAKAGAALADLARRHGADPHLAAAVLSSAIPHLDRIARNLDEYPEALRRQLLVTIARESDAEQISTMLADEPDYDLAVILLESLRAQNKLDPAKFKALIERARGDVFEKKNSQPSITAIRLLGITGATQGLEQFLTPSSPPTVQKAAVLAIGSVPTLLKGWDRYSPSLRGTIAASLAADPANAEAILDYFKAKPQAALAFTNFLFGHPDEKIRERTRLLFRQPEGTREKIVARYKAAAKDHQPVPADGRAIFEKACSACHALDGIGKNVGPDLRALTDRSSDALLAAILDPNRAVEDKYTTYLLKLRDESLRLGTISSETSTSLSLALPDGSSDSVLRSDLKEIESTGRSLMPEGLESLVKPDEMRDLIAWIAKSREKPRSFPGNEPATISASDDGKFHLSASRAEIYGQALVFEAKYKNLGFWNRQEDHAVWTIDCNQPGRYRVEIDFACPDNVAGNGFRFGPVAGKITSTGSWDEYQQKEIGELELVRGMNRLTFRSAGPINGFLVDLRSVTLAPIQE